ncbi:MAG: hypothetical protein ACJ714_09700 [Ornithinibacter sp.]
MTLSVRRSVAALAVGAALVLAGCGGPAGPDRAAVVDGQVITETAVQSAMSEVNSMKPALLQDKLSPTGTLTALVQAPVVLSYLSDLGVKVSESVAKADAQKRGVSNPSDSTLEILKFASAIGLAQNEGKLTDSDAQALTQKLQGLSIDVNPRYGTFNPQTAAVELTTPAWVKQQPAAQ